MSDRKRVLFVCTGNSARSQMAEGLLRHISKRQVDAFSAGTEPQPVNPLAVRVMAFRRARDEIRQRITLFLLANRIGSLAGSHAR